MYIYNCERMKLPSCPRTLIINILRKNPDGLTLTSIAELTGLHRHTATKYIYELKGAGVINERDVGSAKLCYLKEGFSREEQKKLVGRLNGTAFKNRKSSAGQVQILALFMFIFLVPASIIIAQNATQGMNSTGELILGQMNATNEAFTDPGQAPETPNGTASAESNMSAITDEPNETTFSENQTLSPEGNQTTQEENITQENPTEPQTVLNETQENLTIQNETVSNETIQNETEATIILPDSQTPPNVQVNTTIPEVLQPILTARIISPEKTLRGEQFDVSAIVSNTGNSEARNVRLEWILPDGFEIVSGQDSADCGAIDPDSEYMSSLTISAPPSVGIGKNEIKVVVRYEE
jgi:hypothetical protein